MRRLLGVVLTVTMLTGGLVLVTAGSAAACSCPGWGSEADIAASADAVFVGTLVARFSQVDPAARAAREELAREFTRTPPRAGVIDKLQRTLRRDSSRVVSRFQVRRVYKGAVGERQDLLSPTDTCGLSLRGVGPFLVFAWQPSPEMARQYQLEPGQYSSNLCSGSRALADGGAPDLGPPTDEPGWPDSAAGIVALVIGAIAGVGLAALRTRRRASAE